MALSGAMSSEIEIFFYGLKQYSFMQSIFFETEEKAENEMSRFCISFLVSARLHGVTGGDNKVMEVCGSSAPLRFNVRRRASIVDLGPETGLRYRCMRSMRFLLRIAFHDSMRFQEQAGLRGRSFRNADVCACVFMRGRNGALLRFRRMQRKRGAIRFVARTQEAKKRGGSGHV